MIGELAGIDAELTFLEDVGREAYRLEDLSPADVLEARAVIAQYRDQDLGLTDASLVVLSRKLG